MVNSERIVEEFLNMVKISSPSLQERNIADYVKKELISLGLEVVEDKAGENIGGNAGNVIGILRAPGKTKVMLTAHMDTVQPCANVKPIIENGIIKSDGTTILGGDDKAGIVNILEALRVVKENNLDHPEIIVVFSIAEEIGLLGAKGLDIDSYKPDVAYILDSSGKCGVGITKTPYAAKGAIKIIGKAAHAGIAPETGINALNVAAHAIVKMKLGRIDSDTTANIGMVHGGEAINIVMPEVTLKYEARSFSGEKLDNLLKESFEILEKECEKFDAKVEIDVVKGYSGYQLEESEDIVKYFTEACSRIGVKSILKSTGGGSDSNIYSAKGYKAMTLGVGMSKVHTKDEYIAIEDLIDTTKLVVELIKGIK